MPAPQRLSPLTSAKVLCLPGFHTLSGSDFSQQGSLGLLCVFICFSIFCACQSASPMRERSLLGLVCTVSSALKLPGPSQVFTKYLLNGQRIIQLGSHNDPVHWRGREKMLQIPCCSSQGFWTWPVTHFNQWHLVSEMRPRDF